MRLVPIIPNPRFYKQRHVNLTTVLHDVDDFFFGSVDVFFGHFEDGFICNYMIIITSRSVPASQSSIPLYITGLHNSSLTDCLLFIHWLVVAHRQFNDSRICG